MKYNMFPSNSRFKRRRRYHKLFVTTAKDHFKVKNKCVDWTTLKTSQSEVLRKWKIIDRHLLQIHFSNCRWIRDDLQKLKISSLKLSWYRIRTKTSKKRNDIILLNIWKGTNFYSPKKYFEKTMNFLHQNWLLRCNTIRRKWTHSYPFA